MSKWRLLAVLLLSPIAYGGIAGVLPGGAQSAAANPTWFGATLPTLPEKFSTAMPASLSCTNTNAGSCFTPTTGAQLQTDLNTAASDTGTKGDIIECTAGTTYSASAFTLPQRAAGSSGVIYAISSDAPEIGGTGLPAAGTPVWADWPPIGSLAFSSASGTLPAGTYHYGVTSTTASGESTVAPIQSITTSGTGEVTITWAAQVNATGYRVYRSTDPNIFDSGAVYFAVSGGSTTSFTDTGAAGTAGTPPITNTTVDIGAMCSLRSTASNTGGPVINRGTAASQYRLVGIDAEVTDANVATNTNYWVMDFDNGDTSQSTLASYITIDRSYVAGSPSYGVRHAIQLDGDYMAVVDSFVNDIPLSETEDSDNNAILVINSLGPYQIDDNYLEAGGETTLFGGSDTSLATPSEPSNIDIENNHYYKPAVIFNGTTTAGSPTVTVNSVSYGVPLAGMQVQGAGLSGGPKVSSVVGSTMTLASNASSTATGTLVGTPFGKNALEFKTGDRVLFKNNFVENAGANGQSRSAFVLTARDQSGGNPWYTLTDFTIEDNVFTNATNGGTNWLVQDSSTSSHETEPAFRILFRNNMIIQSANLGSDWYGEDSILSNGSSGNNSGVSYDLVIDHNDFIATTTANCFLLLDIVTGGPWLSNVVWSNNIFDQADYQFEDPTVTTNWANMAALLTDPALVSNVFVGGSATNLPAGMGNAEPANDAAVGFTSYGSNLSAGGYALTSGSPYHGVGVSGLNLPYTSAGTADGTDIGANVSSLPVN